MYDSNNELTCYEALETPAPLSDLWVRATPSDDSRLARLPEELRERVRKHRPATSKILTDPREAAKAMISKAFQ